MEFTNTFHVPLPIDQAWLLLLDVPRIMPCLPGAKLTEVVGPGKYKGSVSVKLGPVSLTFNGLVELVKQDDTAHIAWLKGSGVDPKGRGGAQSEFSFALTEAGAGTDVLVTTNLALSGSVAQYGRGSGMISEVAAQILKQFEKNLAKSFAQPEGAAAGTAPGAASAGSPAAGANGAASAHVAVADAPSSVLPGAASVPTGASTISPDTATASPHAAPAAGVAAATTAAPASAGVHAPASMAAMAAAADGAASPVAPSSLHSTAGAPAAPAPAPVYRQTAVADDEPVQEINMLAIGLKAMWRSFLGMFGIGKR
jgi:carbon monoxide dehydrogenase subunit G